MMVTSLIALSLAGAAPAAACVPAPAAGHAGASALSWYINADAIKLGGKNYTKYGLPRVLGADDVELLAPYKGGFVYVEKGSKEREIIYLLTRFDGCEFQPYQVEA
jgi:hypothetical protein